MDAVAVAVAAVGTCSFHLFYQTTQARWNMPVRILEWEHGPRDTIARLWLIASSLLPGSMRSYMAICETSFIQNASRHAKMGTIPGQESLLLRRQSNDGTTDWSVLYHRVSHRRNKWIIFWFWVSNAFYYIYLRGYSSQYINFFSDQVYIHCNLIYSRSSNPIVIILRFHLTNKTNVQHLNLQYKIKLWILSLIY